MAEIRVQGMPVQLVLWARLQQQLCQVPACVCAHGLLFVWLEGRRGLNGEWKGRRFWELRTKNGHRCQGSAPSDSEAVRFGAETLKELGLDGGRLRVVFGRPVEVPHA